MLQLLDRLPAFASVKSEMPSLIGLSENVSRQLRSWAGSLQDSEIRGQRYLTDKTRQTVSAARERDKFIVQLRQAQEDRLANLLVWIWDRVTPGEGDE